MQPGGSAAVVAGRAAVGGLRFEDARGPLYERTNSMEFVHEVTAYLENKPGRLAKICSALAQEKVDIRALSVMETEGPAS